MRQTFRQALQLLRDLRAEQPSESKPAHDNCDYDDTNRPPFPHVQRIVQGRCQCTNGGRKDNCSKRDQQDVAENPAQSEDRDNRTRNAHIGRVSAQTEVMPLSISAP